MTHWIKLCIFLTWFCRRLSKDSAWQAWWVTVATPTALGAAAPAAGPKRSAVEVNDTPPAAVVPPRPYILAPVVDMPTPFRMGHPLRLADTIIIPRSCILWPTRSNACLPINTPTPTNITRTKRNLVTMSTRRARRSIPLPVERHPKAGAGSHGRDMWTKNFPVAGDAIAPRIDCWKDGAERERWRNACITIIYYLMYTTKNYV